MKKDKKHLLRYALLDYFSALFAWQLFSVYRFYEVRSTVYFSTVGDFLMNTKAYLMSAGLPLFWLLIYFYFGYYTQPRQKNHLSDLLSSLFSTLVGALIIFFAVIIDDYPEQYTLYYKVFVGLFLIHFFCTWFIRFWQTSYLLNQQAEGKLGIHVLIIGSGEEADKLSRQMQEIKPRSAYLLKGFIRIDPNEGVVPDADILGGPEELKDIIAKEQIEALILATDRQDSDYIEQVLKQLYVYRLDILSAIKRQDILFSNVALYPLSGVPLKYLSPGHLKAWEQNIKRSLDIVISLLGLLVLSPFFLLLALWIRCESPGPVFYRQVRLGKDMKAFNILKFRTMYKHSEPDGPLLSSLNDERITPFGRFLRKYRLDELPQFWNVLKGDMSLVGPRPERPYYVEHIVDIAPHYHLIYRIKPGITSLGMVKYGYADSVDKMVERLEYDLIYLKNQSLLMDFKILIFTFKPIALGKGI